MVNWFTASSKTERVNGFSSSVTSRLWPGASDTRLQPASCLKFSPAALGNSTYTCDISSPATSPVFFTVKLTAWPASSTFRPEYENSVYESPNPNGYKGSLFSESNHL